MCYFFEATQTRPSPHRRPNVLCSICVHSSGALATKAVGLFSAALQSQKMGSETKCSIKIFVKRQPFGCNSKARIFDPQFGVFGETLGLRTSPCDSPTISSYELLIDTYALTLTILSYLTGPSSVGVHPAMRSTRIRFGSYSFVERQKLS